MESTTKRAAKLEAKSQAVEFKELLRSSRTVAWPAFAMHRASIGSDASAPIAGAWCRSHRFLNTIRWTTRRCRSGSPPTSAARSWPLPDLGELDVRAQDKEDGITADVFGFLTCQPNAGVGKVLATDGGLMLRTTLSTLYNDKLLLMVRAAMAFVFLVFGQGAFSREDHIASLVLSGHDKDSIIGSKYGLYTKKRIPGVLLRLIFPMCLFAGVAFVGAT